MKICLVASRGGHLDELQFVKYMDLECEYFWITERYSGRCEKKNNVYYVDPVNRREPLVFFKIIRLFCNAFRILKKEQPDCFISTGALIAVPILLLGKMSGKKIIFIETFARVESGSLTGRIVYLFADVFIIYWKNLLRYYPKAVYIDLFEEEKYDPGDGRNTEIPV